MICANIKTRDEPAIDGKITETLVRHFHVKGQVVSVGFIGALYDKTNVSDEVHCEGSISISRTLNNHPHSFSLPQTLEKFNLRTQSLLLNVKLKD